MLYQKLNFKPIDIDLERIRLPGKTAYGKTFFEYEINDSEYLREKLNQVVEFEIPPHLVNITEITYPGAIPHTDAWTVGLNFYFDAGEDITYYFDEINKDINAKHVKETNVKMYDRSNLKVIDTFVANRHDWYILNTSVPHAVKCHQPGTVRTMLRCIWYKHSIETILNSLKIKS